jgi:PAS domain S-box-containing protein
MKFCDPLPERDPPSSLGGGVGEPAAYSQLGRAELEQKLAERDRELAKVLGLLKATLESTTDGILALDLSGRVMSYNTKFAAIWDFPPEMLERRDHVETATFSAAKFKDPDKFLARTEDSQSHPEAESFDTFELRDGRIFERRALPLRVGKECVGVVVNWHDVTKRRRAEQELHDAQALYYSLVDQMPSGVFRKDAGGRYVFANAAFCRITGMSADQILGRTSPELVASMKAAQGAECPVMEALGALGASHHELIMRTGQEIEVEDEYVDGAGKSRYYHVYKSPVFGFGGEVIGSQGILLDISERKRAEGDLESERALVRSLLDYSPDHIYFKDLRSRFLKTSQKHAEQFGLQHADEAVGKSDFDFFDVAHARPAFEEEQEIIRTGRPMIGRVQRKVAKDGRVSWALTSKMPLRDKTGAIIGTFGISKDITAMKESEAKLEQVHRELLDTSRQAGMAEVATGVLHNVGNVLNSVNVAANMLAERLRKSKITSVGRVAALMQEHAQDLGEFMTADPKGRLLPSFLEQLSAHLAAEQAAALEELSGLEKNIDHIKDIVAMQQSYAKVSGVTEKVNVLDLVEDALRMNDRALIRHDVKLVREYETTAAEITVEKHKVMQILINLVRNAKYACDESGVPEKRMAVRVAKEPERVKISIIDNGIGIPAENLTRIFNHGFTTRKNGHGFGLHSGALAAKEMGGALIAQSEGPGKGASFTLELPWQPPPPKL